MRQWIKAIPLGIGLPIVIGAASVKPQDAASNLLAWAHWLGIEQTPGWLSDPAVDRWAIAGALTLGATYTFMIWGVPAIRRMLGRKPKDVSSETSLPLEIVFDPANPAQRFWSRESPRDKNGHKLPGVFWEYRVGIRNNSQKTVHNVSVTVEHVGQNLPVRPVDAIFDKTRKTSCDLKPGTDELIPVIRWPIPIVQAGMLAGSTAFEYGPVRVTASGDDIPPTMRTFQFDYQSEPMIFDSLPPPPPIRDALRIVFGASGPFETKKAAGLYKTNHTFAVAVENSHPARFISNCKLFLNIANENDGARQDYWLDGPFTLNPTEQRIREIVRYLEPSTISKHSSDFIQLLIPIGNGFGVGYGWPWRLPVGTYLFSLKAISMETAPVEVTCKIWIDDEFKLHFEKA
jgi:hypothetical protein